MKTLVLGDIHGNVIALNKVLNEWLPKVDQLVCHGDVVNYGPWSNECVELLQQVNAITLKGNHEEAFLKGFYPGSNPLVQQFFQKTFPDFKYLDIIDTYKDFHFIGDFEITHTINHTYYYPDSDLSDVHLDKHTIIGHSHYAFSKVLSNGFSLTNTGSVGQNRKDLSLINFAILDDESKEVTIQEIKYDPLPVIEEMIKQHYPVECVDYYLKKLK